jgi:hypothetical protein
MKQPKTERYFVMESLFGDYNPLPLWYRIQFWICRMNNQIRYFDIQNGLKTYPTSYEWMTATFSPKR